MKKKPWWQVPGSPLISKKVTLQSRYGPIGKTWLGEQFVSVLEEYGENGRLVRAKQCARQGFGRHIQIHPGQVRMQVGCTGRSARQIGFVFPRVTEEAKERMVDLIAGNAALTGTLLMGSLSWDLVDELKAIGVHLIPEGYRAVRSYCDCSDHHNPCIHIGAAWYFMTEIVDEDPWVLFLLQGITKEELIDQVQARRNAWIAQEGPSNQDPGCDDETGQEEWYDCSSFFSCIGDRDIVDGPIPSRTIAPIRLIGPAPYRLGGKNLADRIDSLYPFIREYAASLLGHTGVDDHNDRSV